VKKFTVIVEDGGNETEFRQHVDGPKAHRALWEIGQQIFRPARKHGYNDRKLNEYLEKDEVFEAIGRLEEMFYDIIEQYDVDIE
jgi:hypothetical protein